MGNNKCKPIDFEFDGVCSIVNTVPFGTLSTEEKDSLFCAIMPVIVAGKENITGFDIDLLYIHVTPYTRVDVRDVIMYAMKRLRVKRPYILVKNQRDVKYHVLFVEDL
jgi:hypothetical protein